MIPVIDARLVAKMRAAQREYYRSPSKPKLDTSKELERQVDRAILDATRQMRLPFDREVADGE